MGKWLTLFYSHTFLYIIYCDIMQIRGKNISWQHLCTLYQAKVSMMQRSNGLYSRNCPRSTSYSRMRVDLAAEVSIDVSVRFLCLSLPLTHELFHDLHVHVGTEYFNCRSFQLLWQFRNYKDTKVYQNV